MHVYVYSKQVWKVREKEFIICIFCSVSLVPTSLAAKKTEEAVLILLISGVDTANKVCYAYIKHQSAMHISNIKVIICKVIICIVCITCISSL